MVKAKASPGKRYCKKCQKLIPIHCRICNFCSAPQYTMQQITKEYKKRQKFTDESDPIKLYENQFLPYNPFETSLPLLTTTSSLPNLLPLTSLSLKFNTENISIPPLSCFTSADCTVLNPCGKTNTLAFSCGTPAYLCISLCPCEIHYGRTYEGPGLLQLWELSQEPLYKYSVLHMGFTVLSMRFLPCKNSQGIGTLAACLANGDLCLYNFPYFASSTEALSIQPFSVFRIPGLIFSCLIWTHSLTLAAGTQDGSIFYIVPGCEPLVKVFNAHRLPITSIACCALDLIATTSLDGDLKVWDKKGALVDSLCLSKRWCYHITNNPLGNYLFYDNDAAVCPHKVIKLEDGKLESKKQLSQSTEATVSSCFSPVSNFDYIVTAEGYVEAIYVSELEKNSKKRKTPWDRYSRIVYVKEGDVCIGGHIPEKISCVAKGSIKRIDLLVRSSTAETIAWVGEVCGIYQSHFEEYNS